MPEPKFKAPRKKVSKSASQIPDHASADVIGEMTGYSRQAVNTFATQGIIPASAGKEGYPFAQSILGICEMLRGREKEHVEVRKKAEADKAVTDAKQAELEHSQALGDLMPTKDAKLLWSEAMVEVRSLVEREEMGSDLRDRLLAKLGTVRLSEEI